MASPQGYYSFKEKAGFELAILKHYCRGICTHFDPIAVPVIIHRKDLERIAPLWLKWDSLLLIHAIHAEF